MPPILRTMILSSRLAPCLLVVAAGCGPSVSLPTNRDAAQPAPADLAEPPDLGPVGSRYHYVINELLFPQQRSDYAYDLNGDGFADNQFGALAQAVAADGLRLQAASNQAILDGDALVLVALVTRDPSFVHDPSARGTLYAANPTHPADFTGAGAFTIDPLVPHAPLAGALASATFTSADPSHAAAPPTASLRVVLEAGRPLDLPLVGARVTFKVTGAALSAGQINGALRASDVTNLFVPALAANLTLVEQRTPCDVECSNVRSTLDLNHDGTVTPTELTSGPLRTLLLADVQLFDASGAWSPSPTNLNKNAYSFGFGFAAVKATFTE